MVRNGDVAIVGGGIVGLASALGAIQAGASVTLFDPHVGRGATYAAAGMLSPGGEFLGGFQSDYEEAARAFGAWNEFADYLGVSLHRCETELVGWSHGDREDIARYVATARNRGVTIGIADPQGFELTPRAVVSAAVTNEGFVDVDEVVAALTSTLAASGVKHVSESVAAVEPHSGYVVVQTATSRQEYRRVIIATGSSLSCLSTGFKSKVHAVRGVTLRVQMRPGQPAMLRAFIDGQSVYLVRRPNGVTVIGASSDQLADAIVQSRDVHNLLELATKIVPSIQDATFIDARAGLRPASVDGLAFFEKVSPQLAWTSGYFRHGVLMAPSAVARAKDFCR